MSESVQEVLEAAVTDPETETDTALMRHLVDDERDIEPEDLTYEDWIRPMELTTGRICLKIWPPWVDELPDRLAEPDDHALYFRRTDEGQIERAPPDEHGRSTMSDMHFAPTISAQLPNVEPVLFENTPFADRDQEADSL